MHIINKIFKFKFPLLMGIIIIFASIFSSYLPYKVQSGFYTFSLILKEILMFILPFIIFSLILSSIVNLKRGAIKLIITVIPMICLSNWISIWIGYSLGQLIVNYIPLYEVVKLSTNKLEPLLSFSSPTWISVKVSMISSIILGLFSLWFYPKIGKNFSNICNIITLFILNKIIIRLLPVMILGYIIKMQYDDMLETLIKHYIYIFFIVTGLLLIYITLLYIIVNKFKTKAWCRSMYNMLPPAIAGMSTMSSATVMPMTLVAVNKNVKNSNLVNFVVPITVNFHLIGDIIAMTIFSITVMATYNYTIPSPTEFFAFSFYHMLGRFSMAAIPGGGVFVLMPLLIDFFNFTPVMLGLMQTLNLMFDSIVTGVNILGNGIFAIFFNKLLHFTKR